MYPAANRYHCQPTRHCATRASSMRTPASPSLRAVSHKAASDGAKVPRYNRNAPSSVFAGIRASATVKKHAHISAYAARKKTRREPGGLAVKTGCELSGVEPGMGVEKGYKKQNCLNLENLYTAITCEINWSCTSSSFLPSGWSRCTRLPSVNTIDPSSQRSKERTPLAIN